MAHDHVIEVVATDFGVFPQVVPLNPMLAADGTLLKLTVHVNWHPPGDAAERLRAAEERLAAAAPSLGLHQCRGPHQYRLFQEGRAATDGAAFEPALALAHLFEHVIIDAVAYVTEAPRVSGLTGERGDVRLTFDVFVECPDRVVAEVTTRLCRSWVEEVLSGASLDGGVRRTLDLARRLYRQRPAAVDAAATARTLGVAVEDAEDGLLGLVHAGFAREEPTTLNLSGGRRFRCLAAAAPAGLLDAGGPPALACLLDGRRFAAFAVTDGTAQGVSPSGLFFGIAGPSAKVAGATTGNMPTIRSSNVWRRAR